MPDKKRELTIAQVDYDMLARFLGFTGKKIIGIHTTDTYILLYLEKEDDGN